MKIVVLDQMKKLMGPDNWELFESLGEVVYYDSTNPNETVDRVKDADAIIVNKVDITKEVMDASPNLKYIGLLSTGYNVVDVDYAKEKGIAVTNIPAYGTDTVAEFTIGMLLALSHRFEFHSESVKKGEWKEDGNFCYNLTPQIELAGKTLGIIGLGKIGMRVAELALAFKMNVLAYTKYSESYSTDNIKFVSLDELLRESDFVSMHCPATPETNEMANADFFSKMKKGSLFLNMSRGQLMVEEDLAEALNSGHLGGAAIDALTVEPIEDDNPLLKAKNIIITPHMAWTTKEAIARIMFTSVDNLKSFMDGETMNRVV